MPLSADLTEKISGALRLLEKSLDIDAGDLAGDFIDPGADDFDPSEYEFDESDEISFTISDECDEPFRLTYAELPAFAQEVSKAELVNDLECWTPKRLFVRVENTGSYDSHLRLDAILDSQPPQLLQSYSVDGCNYELYLVSGTTSFGFMVFKSKNWNDYYPSAYNGELFVEVRWDGKIDKQVAKRLIDSLIFELASTLGILLQPAPHPYFDPDAEADSAAPLSALKRSVLRPLLFGKGVSDVIGLYIAAIGTHDPEFQVIGFAKVLEHVSETVVREQLTSSVRTKLLSPRALDPSAQFILELTSVISEHTKQYRKDSEALKLTIAKCCEATELAQHAPSHLQLSTVTAATKDKEKQKALDDFAACLSATRNEIAHAKLSYEATGNECPSEKIVELASCSRVAAEQAIRWYAVQHDNIRVIETAR